MLKLSRIFKNYAETGALNENVPIWGFIDEYVFLTKGGDLGVVLEVDGVDYEGLSPDELDAYTARLQAAFKTIDSNYRVYQYFFKRNHEPIPFQLYGNEVVDAAVRDRMDYFRAKAGELYSYSIYYVILFEGFRYSTSILKSLVRCVTEPARGRAELKALFADRKQVLLIEDQIDRARKPLLHAAQTFILQINDFVTVRMLPKADGFRMLRRLLNFDPVKLEQGLKYDTMVDYFLGSSQLEFYPSHALVDGYYTRVLTLRDPPSKTWSIALKALFGVNANFHVVTEWRRLPNDQANAEIKKRRKHFHNTKTAVTVSNATADQQSNSRRDEPLVDESKVAIVQELAELQTHIELGGGYLGYFTLTIVLYDQDPEVVEKAHAELVRVFSSHSGEVIDERYNIENAFFATIPGNYAFNLRAFFLLNRSYADMSFLFTLHTGSKYNTHLNAEYLAVLETDHSTPYYCNLHDGDLAHTALFGRAGAGKSFTLNFLVTNLQKYKPYTFIFDVGGSFRGITQLFGGSFIKIGLDTSGLKINPFVLPPTRENRHFLFSFLKVLLEGGAQAPLTPADDREVFEAIENVYELQPSLRTLSSAAAMLPKALSQRLQRWLSDGQYGNFFDNADDNLTFSRFQTFDFEGMEDYPDILEPLLFYILHRAKTVIYDPATTNVLKAFVMDEAFRFFQHPTIKAYILEAYATWRKKNAAFILATQKMEQIPENDLKVIVGNCATQIFLADPNSTATLYSEVLRLKPHEIDIVRQLVPKREALIKQRKLTKKVQLNVDAKSYWLYTNDANDNFKRDEAFRQYGFERGLEVLAEGVPA